MSQPFLSKDMKSKEATYLKLALAHARVAGRGGASQEPMPTISPKTPEWDAWRHYFVSHLGFEPYAMKRTRIGEGQEMTVPAERPEDFDCSYRGKVAA